MCTGGSRWVLGMELLGLPETHTAALTSLSFRGSLPPSKTVAILFNEETGPTPRKKPKKTHLPANFGPGLPSYSTDAHNTYKEQEIEKEEEVLGDFYTARPHLLSLAGPKGKADRQ